MIKKSAVRLVKWQIEKGILQEEQRTTYEYAYEVLMSKVVNIVIAVIIALMFHAPLIVATLLAVYIPMRTYAGGYHAETNLGCTVISATIVCVVCYLVQNIPSEVILPFNIMAGLAAAFIIGIFVPVAAAHKPLDEIEVRRYRLRAYLMYFAGVCLGAAAYYYGLEQISFTIFLAYMILATMLVIGKIQTDEGGSIAAMGKQQETARNNKDSGEK